MRRDIGPEVDITNMGALLEIDDAKKMFVPILSTAIIPRELFVSAIVFPRCR